MVTKYYLREEQHWELKKFCDELNIDFCSTPFSPKEAELLNDLGVPFFKVASMDINNLVLLEKLADYGKPIVLSTGMASLSEVEQAVEKLLKKRMSKTSLSSTAFPSTLPTTKIFT
jgi:sialic acid synthase SpsE